MPELSLNKRLAKLEKRLAAAADAQPAEVRPRGIDSAAELAALRREAGLIGSEYRLLYRSLPAMIHSVDGEGRLLSVSDVWLRSLGYERGEVIGRPLEDFMTPASARLLTEQVLPAFLKTGRCENIEYRLVAKTGQVLDVLLSATAEYDGQGHYVRSLSVLLDISERKRMEERLRESNERLAEANADLERFAFVASHDLQEPLRKVEVACNMLREDHADILDEDANQLFDIAQSGARRMRQMILDILAFSRLKGERLEKQPVDLGAVFEAAREELRQAIEESGVTLAFRSEPGLAMGEGTMLRQVFLNLMSNAIRYRGEAPPAIEVVAARREAEGWLVTVTDNGIGVPPAYAERIFEIFQRLQPRNEKGGNGIGLALCRRIVERHGGRIWLDPDYDRGCRILFTLPAA